LPPLCKIFVHGKAEPLGLAAFASIVSTINI
jgi:hypothetical protein